MRTDKLTMWDVLREEWPRILAASAFAAVAVGGFVWLWLALGVAP